MCCLQQIQIAGQISREQMEAAVLAQAEQFARSAFSKVGFGNVEAVGGAGQRGEPSGFTTGQQ